MVRVAPARCPRSASAPELMRRTAELAESLDVRPAHPSRRMTRTRTPTALERFGSAPGRAARGGRLADRAVLGGATALPSPAERRAGSAPPCRGWPTAPARTCRWRAAGSRRYASRGCGGQPRSGSAATARHRPADSAWMWTEARAALLLAALADRAERLTAREVARHGVIGRRLAARPGGEIGELSVSAEDRDLVCWPQDGARLRRGADRPSGGLAALWPGVARHTVGAGRVIVRDGAGHPRVDDVLARHAAAAAELQRLTG